jgi:hypothetical protein
MNGTKVKINMVIITNFSWDVEIIKIANFCKLRQPGHVGEAW